MEVVRSLLVQGNDKLSQAIFHWDIPALETCPGASDLCASKCYARRGRFCFPQVRDRLDWCYEQSLCADFSELMIAEIRKKGAAFILRIHVSGDVYSAEYAHKWLAVIRHCKTTTFYGYSRSWRDEQIAPALEELARCSNMHLWYSADSETGMPPTLPERVRVAYLQTVEDEEIPEGVDLIFRDYPLRILSAHPLVCPVETEAGKDAGMNCGVCGKCFTD